MFLRTSFTCLSLCCNLALVGCATTMGAVPIWQEAPVTVSFTVKESRISALPLQGGMEVDSAGGRMALMTQNGYTLGQCVWQESPNTQQGQDSAAGIVMQCTASDGLGEQVKSMVRRVALANYRILYSQKHSEEKTQGMLKNTRYSIEKRDKTHVYSDNLGEMEIVFSSEGGGV